MADEKRRERRLKREVEKSGGLAIKIASPWFRGLPDRLVLMPGRKFFWAEMKSTGKKLGVRQAVVKRLFEKLGFEVDVLDTDEKLDEFLNKIRK
jgi:Holliday junction resolvase